MVYQRLSVFAGDISILLHALSDVARGLANGEDSAESEGKKGFWVLGYRSNSK
jgi:hypothetical protein